MFTDEAVLRSAPAELNTEPPTVDASPAVCPASHSSAILLPAAGPSSAVSVETSSASSDQVLSMFVPTADPPVQLVPDRATPTSPVDFFVDHLPVPIRQRNTKGGRGRSKLASFVLTSDEHLFAIEDKDARNKKETRNKKPARAKTGE